MIISPVLALTLNGNTTKFNPVARISYSVSVLGDATMIGNTPVLILLLLLFSVTGGVGILIALRIFDHWKCHGQHD